MTYIKPVKIFEDLPIESTLNDKCLVLFEKKIYKWNGNNWVMEQDMTETTEKYFSIRSLNNE